MDGAAPAAGPTPPEVTTGQGPGGWERFQSYSASGVSSGQRLSGKP